MTSFFLLGKSPNVLGPMKLPVPLAGRNLSVFRIISLLVLGFLTVQIPPAFSHYPWITLENDSEEFGIMNFYFEDKPGPGIGEYLQPFVEGAKTWIRTLKTQSHQQIQLIEVNRQGNKWLTAELSQLGPRSVESYAKWGVYKFPKTGIDTLLHYYAKHLNINSPQDLQDLGTANDFLLDIIPGRYVKPSRFFPLDLGVIRLSNFINRWIGPSVEILVRWKGHPAADTHVIIRGPTGPKIHFRTDTKGYVRFQAPESGLWTFVTYVEESDLKGVDQGKKIRCGPPYFHSHNEATY